MWRPLITDAATCARITSVVGEIARAVAAAPPIDDAELAVLFAYLASCDRDWELDRAPDEHASALLDRAIEAVPRAPHLGLWGGTSGIGWALAHVAGESAAATTAVIDEIVLAALAATPWRDHYDLISGLVGIGVYALERGAAGRAIAIRVLDHLEASAVRTGDSVSWFTRAELLPAWQRGLAPDGYTNLGLAHGVPGAIALLARYVEHDIAAERASTLLAGAVQFVLDSSPTSTMGRFPTWIGARPDRRVSWCYGDLGVAVALVRAGRVCERAAWSREGLELALATAARDADVLDACVCHGASGNAHLLSRLWQATGDNRLREAARRWLDRVFLLRCDHPFAGFPEIVADGDHRVRRASTSMLAGAAGVGLVLLAAVGEPEPAWDRRLLTDLGCMMGG